jgi:non-ribosomal peptide synthase protein (TIGR01720 family)
VPASSRAGDVTAGLRGYLSDRLPDYLVPGALVQVAEFPLTPNGKLDRAALSASPVPAPDPTAGYVAPRDEPERILTELFAAALGAARVGVHDHFLDLGGDSISAIGVTARAQAHGLVFAARDVLRLGTPAALAAAAGSTGVPAPQGVLDGPVCPTPIQRWYLERDLPDPGYFSQAVLLTVPPETSVATLRQALRAVLAHHDALRIRVDSTGGAPLLSHAAPDDVPLTVRRHRAADARELAAEATRAQRALGAEKGDSLAAVLFTGLDPAADRLLLAVHHLLVDVVSWPVLLGDLESAYRAVEQGRQPRFPRKTTSFQQWARHLSDWATGPRAGAALDWWTTNLDVPVPAVPADVREGDPAAPFGDERSAGSVEIGLDRAATAALTARGSAAGGPRTHELLAAALAVGYRRWSGHDRLLLDVEGHGRHPLADGLDVSRTVGWFTALHPVLLDLTGASTTAAALDAVAARLRAVPDGGVGHGALRYSGGEAAARLAALPAPQVSFNYVGAFGDRVERAGGWRMAPEPLGPERAPGNPRAHLLAVQGHLVDDRLHLSIEYSGDRHRRESVTRLAEHVHAALTELAEPVPPDLSCLLTDTTAEELHDLLDEVDFSDDRE